MEKRKSRKDVFKKLFLSSVMMLTFVIVAVVAVVAVEAQDETSDSEGFTADIPKAPTPVPEGEQKFIYNDHGMRDPFVSLLLKPDDEFTRSGLAAMKISELKLQGIQIGLGKTAIVLGTDGKAYSLEIGQNLVDGKVVDIHSRKVIFEKVILDAFGREKDKQRIELYLH